MTTAGVPFLKGHGTENDFILLPDLDDALTVSQAQVRALCDRRAGLGADGVIRVVPAAPPQTGFFMDYRNADGSHAEMCGNGARVFARYLVKAGLQQPGRFDFVTMGGVRTAELGIGGDVSVGLGMATVGAESKAELSGRTFKGTAVGVGNPHLVCLLGPGSAVELADLDLSVPPGFDHTVFRAGVNVEFVLPLSPDHIRMRVYERGVGETRSCGTGTVAAAAAFLAATGSAGSRVTVDVPGGSVVVTFSTDGATLTGPAVLVASGTIDRDYWDLHR